MCSSVLNKANTNIHFGYGKSNVNYWKKYLKEQVFTPGFWTYNSYRSVFQFCLSLFWIWRFFLFFFFFCFILSFISDHMKLEKSLELAHLHVYQNCIQVILMVWAGGVCVFNWQRFCLSCTESPGPCQICSRRENSFCIGRGGLFWFPILQHQKLYLIFHEMTTAGLCEMNRSVYL